MALPEATSYLFPKFTATLVTTSKGTFRNTHNSSDGYLGDGVERNASILWILQPVLRRKTDLAGNLLNKGHQRSDSKVGSVFILYTDDPSLIPDTPYSLLSTASSNS